MEYKLWIDGKWVDGKGGEKISVENPATGKKIAEVVDASPGGCESRSASGQASFL